MAKEIAQKTINVQQPEQLTGQVNNQAQTVDNIVNEAEPNLLSEQDMEELYYAVGNILNRKYPDIIQKNERLEDDLIKKNQEIVDKTALIVLLHKDNDKLILEREKFIKENEKLKQKIKVLEGEYCKMSPGDSNGFIYDVTNYKADIPTETIDSFFLKLQCLAEKKIGPEKFLVDCSSAVIPIYIILTQDNNINEKFQYLGNLQEFCNEWNCNVAAYITDIERSQKLSCKYESIKPQFYNSPLNKYGIKSWSRKLNEGKNVKVLERAVNMKAQMERLMSLE